MTARTFTFSVVGESEPAWFTAQTESTWSSPVSNTLYSVGGTLGLVDAWTGGCVNQTGRELLLAANGGHTGADGPENCVYGLSLGESSPAWVKLTDSSVVSGGTDATNSRGDYGDGRMRSVHGYNRCVYGDGRVWYAGLDGMAGSGYWSTACWSAERASFSTGSPPPWTFHGIAIPSLPSGYIGEGGPAAFDRVGQQVWSIAGEGPDPGVYAVSTATGTLGDITVPGFGANAPGTTYSWAVVAHDVSPRVLIYGRKDGVVQVINLESPTAFTTVTQSGSPTGLGAAVGAVYHAPSRAVLCYSTDYGASIRKLTIPANPLTGTYAWGSVTNGSGGVTPPGTLNAGFQGVYSKFNLIEDMGDGRGALVMVCNKEIATSTYVYKLPVGAV